MSDRDDSSTGFRKVVLLLVVVAGLAIAFEVLFNRDAPPPPNSKVTVENYRRLRLNMSPGEVEAILGLPHRTTGGRVVRIEHPEHIDIQMSIEELPRSPGKAEVRIFEGPQEADIRVLFGPEGRAVAHEYSIAGISAIYRGPQYGEGGMLKQLKRVVDLNERQRSQYNAFREREKLNRQEVGAGGTQVAAEATVGVSPSVASPAADSPAAEAAPASSEPASMPVVQTSQAATPEQPPSADTGPPPAEQPPSLDTGPPTVEQPPQAGQPQAFVPMGNTILMGPGGTAPPERSATPFNIRLRNRKLFSEEAIELPGNWKTDFFRGAESVLAAEYPSGKPQGLFAVSREKLHGYAATFFANGQPSTLARYTAGKLDGPLRLWDHDGKRVLYAFYEDGRKSGYLCLFREGRPWIIQGYDHGVVEPGEEYVVVEETKALQAIPLDDWKEDQSQQYEKAQQELGEVEAVMKRGQKEVLDWLRKEIPRQRTQRLREQTRVNRGGSEVPYRLIRNSTEWNGLLARSTGGMGP